MNLNTTYSTKNINRNVLRRLIDYLQDKDISVDVDHNAETLSFDLTELSSRAQTVITKALGEPIEENKMKKLTTEQKAKVVKFAKKLVLKEVTIKKIEPGRDSGDARGAIGNYYNLTLSTGETVETWDDALMGRYKELRNKRQIPDIATLNRILRNKEWVIRESKKPIKESANTYTMVSALREITDDLLLQTEMMIDNQYGKADHKQFKALWYKTANEFERKFGTIIKSLMKAGK